MKKSDEQHDFDVMLGIPALLRWRTLQALLLGVLVLSIVAALEWPRAWRIIELADLAALSALFGMAACREWLVRFGRRACPVSNPNPR